MAIGLRERVLIGGTGGVIPIFVNLARSDPRLIFQSFELLVFLGFCVQGIFLFIVGGVVAYFMKSEKDHWKLFVIGMTAPAMLTGINNARQINDSKEYHASASYENLSPILSQTVQVAQIGQTNDFIQILLAAKHESNFLTGPTIEILRAIPRKGRFDKFVRGLLGIKITPPSWFVIDRKFEVSDRESALQRQDHLKEIFAGRSIDIAVVRNPYAGSEDKFYVLLGGEDITSLPKTKYILDRLKPVLFSSAIQAETVAMEAARLLDEYSAESGEFSMPTRVRVTYPGNI